MSGAIRLSGATSGFVELVAPDVAGSTVLELPLLSIKPALVLLTTQSFTAASAVSFNNVFTSDYQNYLVALNITGSADGYVATRLRAGGTDEAGANYKQSIVWNLWTGTVAQATSTTNQFEWGSGIAAAHAAGAMIEVFSPAAAVYTTLIGRSVKNDRTIDSRCLHQIAQAYDGLTLFPTSGTISGTISVYGYTK